MKKTAKEILSLNSPDIIAVVGCGGKTTFIENLAKELEKTGKKILITTTTKIFPVKDKNISLCTSLEQCLSHKAKAGIVCMGILNSATGKLEKLPEKTLEKIVADYDCVLIEADGSRGLPCKGWLDSEPIIPEYVSRTIGIVTLEGLCKAVDESRVMRIVEFINNTGTGYGEMITQESLIKMIAGEEGMFWNSIGEKNLFINKIEDEDSEKSVKDFVIKLLDCKPGYFSHIAYGSALENLWIEV